MYNNLEYNLKANLLFMLLLRLLQKLMNMPHVFHVRTILESTYALSGFWNNLAMCKSLWIKMGSELSQTAKTKTTANFIDLLVSGNKDVW